MRARASFTQEVMFELGHVFDEVGSEAFRWEGNKEQKKGKDTTAKAYVHCGGGIGERVAGVLSGGSSH